MIFPVSRREPRAACEGCAHRVQIMSLIFLVFCGTDIDSILHGWFFVFCFLLAPSRFRACLLSGEHDLGRGTSMILVRLGILYAVPIYVLISLY
ncbi:hypothetical protein DFS33DRAFT_1002431 [Desarmillaria ectypa]|nr:hypothetical protein DFS33DRAFT_1002431 [Desarmillaria ectypa]